MENRYQVLGLKPGASEAEIKGAYRSLAKKYHPDISTAPDAEERFIEITEAYQWLLEGPPVSTSFVDFAEEEPPMDEEEMRRERARAYAKMRYETFKKNNEAFQKAWYYEPVKWAVYLIIILSYALALAMILAPLLIWAMTGNLTMGLIGIFVSLLGFSVFMLARNLHKDVKPYFNY